VTPDAAGLWRSLVVVTVAGAAVLARAVPARTPYASGQLVVAGRCTAALAALWGLAVGVAGPAEALTVPLGVLLLADGWLRMRAEPAAPSLFLAPGLLVLLLPSLVLATTASDVWRLVTLAVIASAAVVVGAQRAWAAPLLVGAAVLTVHALVQLAPVAVVAYEAVPRWVTLALAGAALLAIGARYESRLADLRTLRNRLTDLR
jgi:hypothetical protein